MMNEMMKKMMEEAMPKMMEEMMKQCMASMMASMFGGSSVSATATATAQPEAQKPQKKAQTTFTEDVDIVYLIEKTTAIDGKTFFRIRLENWKDNKKSPYLTKYQKMLFNSKIVALNNRIEFKFKTDDGKTFNGYGYSKKKDAENALKTLKTHFTAKEMTDYAQKMEARKEAK